MGYLGEALILIIVRVVRGKESCDMIHITITSLRVQYVAIYCVILRQNVRTFVIKMEAGRCIVYAVALESELPMIKERSGF